MASLRKFIKPKTRIKHNIAYETVWLDHFETTKNGKKVFGECRFNPETTPPIRQIVLSADQSDSEAFKTYIHEIYHAIETEYEIQIPHKIIEALEVATLRFLKLNGFLK